VNNTEDPKHPLENPKGKVLHVFKQNEANEVTSLERIDELNLSTINGHLRATAERVIGNNQFRLELIYGGNNGVPLQIPPIQTAAADIVTYMNTWFHRRDYGELHVYLGDEFGNAIPDAREHERLRYRMTKRDNPTFGIHMTVGIPLAGFYHIVNGPPSMLFETKPESHPAEIEQRFNAGAHEQNGSIWKQGYQENYGRHTTLGFLFIIQAYVSVAEPRTSHKNNLKNEVPFMPRTDFRTMLRIVCDTMQPDPATKFRNKLARFFQAGHGGDVEKAIWNWGKQEQRAQDGEISDDHTFVVVGEFLKDLDTNFNKMTSDMMTQADHDARNKQIGGLGKRVERILGQTGTDFVGPILEFRKLRSLPLADVNNLQDLANAVIEVHENFRRSYVAH
jgi:hypothetical protein